MFDGLISQKYKTTVDVEQKYSSFNDKEKEG